MAATEGRRAFAPMLSGAAMNSDHSHPPGNSELLDRIALDVFLRRPEDRNIVSLRWWLAEIIPQLPDGVSVEEVTAVLVDLASRFGCAVHFNGPAAGAK